MLAPDLETHSAIQRMASIAKDAHKPLVLWIGAGASTWAGYPTWADLTLSMHSSFSREEPAYDREAAKGLLDNSDYPAIFQLMKMSNISKYYNDLTNIFGPKNVSPIYNRFIQAIHRISPLNVLTTNVDESIERHIKSPELVQRSDIERLPSLLHRKQPFICKLHGSISSIESAIFTKGDYAELLTNEIYLSILQGILSDSHVIFLGYGLRDKYVLRKLEEGTKGRPLFGAGPHFLVTSSEDLELPKIVQRIRYKPDFADHRDALLTLEILAKANSPALETVSDHRVAVPPSHNESLYYLADLIPPGSWQSGQTITAKSPDGSSRFIMIGPGYVESEIELHDYSALHDLVVGLICFDAVCVNIGHLGVVHELLGAQFFWEFVNSNSIRVVRHSSQPSVMFQDQDAPIGDIGFNTLGPREPIPDYEGPITVGELIRGQLKPIPGKESEANRLMEGLEANVYDLIDTESSYLGERTRSALIHPSIRRLLGISGGTPLLSVPRWLASPVLRLAGVVTTGSICQRIGASSARLLLGSELLASAAFSAAAGQAWADEAASYVLTGRFNSDIGALIANDISLLKHVHIFRDSQAGFSFRREIAQRLRAGNDGEFAASINAGLYQALPISVIQSARDQLSGLFEPRGLNKNLTPSVWGDLRNADARISLWRRRSRQLFIDECKRLGIGTYDLCPCGSGEKTKFCCMAALQ